MESLLERLGRSLSHQAPSPEQTKRIEALREAGKDFARVLCAATPPGREQSLAATHLEETIMWAVKSIVLEAKRCDACAGTVREHFPSCVHRGRS